jgi:hypothetical protein
MCEEAPVFTERTSVGLDVHARSVVAAAIDGDTGEVFRKRLTPGNDDVIGWVRSLPGPSAAVYEAGPRAGNQRLHQRWVHFTQRKKDPVVANVAIARELAGWCWSLAVVDG